MQSNIFTGGESLSSRGQAGAALHTMAVLQAYQADLLKDLSTGGSIDEEAFLELRRATDLSLRATKQTARAIGRSMAAMVSTERHLWLNLTGIKDKDRTFLLDAPISPSGGLFGDAVNTVATRFREAKRYEEAFVRFLPRRAQESGTSATRSRPGPVPLRREAQKESVASRAPPRRDWGAARRASQSASKRPDLRSIISSKKKSWGLRAQDPGGVPPPLGGAWKIPTENNDSFLAPSGGRCSISVATGVSGSSGLQRNVTCSVASCHVSGHRTSNIPPSKQSVETSAPFREAGSVEATAKYISVGRKDCRERLQDSVCISASAFQRRGLHFREPERVHLLIQELQALLDKGAIEHVPLPDRESGYYSRYFLVPRRMGGCVQF